MSYTALIRSFNSAGCLPATLEYLARQVLPPARYVFVDSGSTDGTLELLPSGADLVPYWGEEFNYSEALNRGFERVETEFTLVNSSHTTLDNPAALEYAIRLMESDVSIGAAYFTVDAGELTHSVVDADSFDGFNGVANTCALIRTDLVRERRFRPEVFAAEDQEWTRWLVNERRGRVARVSGGGMSNSSNPHIATAGLRKWSNEWVAIAYFVNPKVMGLRTIGALTWQALKFDPTTSSEVRKAKLLLAARLAACHFRAPTASSRYF